MLCARLVGGQVSMQEAEQCNITGDPILIPNQLWAELLKDGTCSVEVFIHDKDNCISIAAGILIRV